mmetsp:Transcript_48475/g.155057  ORF Transcript_48475/g.155057 Transcript_48475/m.155057 type:complete len:222 (-) Transcript_48475:525-1190(-)
MHSSGRGEDLNPALRDEQGVLELRREPPVGGDDRPLILPVPLLDAPHREHGLYREGLPEDHHAGVLVLVVQHGRARVEGLAHAVPHEVAHDAVPVLVGEHLDGGADGLERGAGLAHGDGGVEALLGDLDDLAGLGGDLPNEEGAAGVPVVAFQEHRHVDVHDVPVHQLARVGDAVADALVHRRAHALGELAVVEGGGVGPGLDDHLVHLLVDEVRGHTRLG